MSRFGDVVGRFGIRKGLTIGMSFETDGISRSELGSGRGGNQNRPPTYTTPPTLIPSTKDVRCGRGVVCVRWC